MISPFQYTSDDQAQIEIFAALPSDEQRGYWDKTHEGELSTLKERIKDHYLAVQNYTCPYCRQQIEVKNKSTWDAEHIIPKSPYPKFMFEARNLCVACKDCNQVKWDQQVLVNAQRTTYPANSKDYLISHPHFDVYDRDIKIIVVAGFYLPKTEKGRKTVEICGLLRFLYKFANLDCGTADVDEKLGDLYGELIHTKDGFQRHFLLTAISKIAHEGASALIDGAMEQRFKLPGPTVV